MVPAGEIRAAGAVVLRPRQVLLVHRARYDDWSFPKGKLDRGEHRTAAAVREVEEETGVRIRLGVPLTRQRYLVGDRPKTVDYWVARPTGPDGVEGYLPNAEIDQVAWVDREEAPGLLSYDRDRSVLEEALSPARRKRTDALVVVRHAAARARRTWRADDRVRPLLASGRLDAARMVPTLQAFGVVDILTSPSTRCVETVAPLAAALDLVPRRKPVLAEEDATPRAVRSLVRAEVDALTGTGRVALLCSHRPVLPVVFDALGLDDPRLDPGDIMVVHLRKGRVVAAERHEAHPGSEPVV